MKIFAPASDFASSARSRLSTGCARDKMVVADRLAQGSRPAVHHQPEPAVLVRLDFDEVISAAECCELDRAFVPADGLQTGMAERRWLLSGCVIRSARRFRRRAGTLGQSSARTWPATLGTSPALAASRSRATANMPHPMSPPTACG